MTEPRPHWPAVTWTIPLLFALAYAVWPILGLPRPYYAPETRDIFWDKLEGVPLMGWYGRLLMASVVGIVVGGLAGLIIQRSRASWLRLGPSIAAAGITLAMIFTAVREIIHWMLPR